MRIRKLIRINTELIKISKDIGDIIDLCNETKEQILQKRNKNRQNRLRLYFVRLMQKQ